MTSLRLALAASAGGAAGFAAAAAVRAGLQHLTADTSTWVWVAANAIATLVFAAALTALAPPRHPARPGPA